MKRLVSDETADSKDEGDDRGEEMRRFWLTTIVLAFGFLVGCLATEMILQMARASR